jgi:polar amino acid transport system permease protein
MHALKRIRPSNLVILFAVPFIVYLFATSRDYQRSLREILGIEDKAGLLLASFLLLLVTLLLGAVLPVLRGAGRLDAPTWRRVGLAAAAANIVLALHTAATADLSVFISSVVANSVDPFASDLILKGVRPRQLTPEALAMCVAAFHRGAWIYLAVSVVLTAVAVAGSLRDGGARLARWALGALLLLNGVGIAYLLMVAPMQFASGVFVTLRAAILAYVAAGLLGLGMAGLQQLKPKQPTVVIHAAVCLALLAASAYFFMQPKQTFVLAGSLEKAVAIVQGTPQGLINTVRRGEYEGGSGATAKMRGVVSVQEALAELATKERVSAAFIPEKALPPGAPVLWRVTFLPDDDKLPALAFGIVGLLLAIVTFGGALHNRHPMAIAAEFYVDTLRGIPMLVVILYVGFPLSGTLKDVTDGGIDLSNMTRGIIALALGYSAYMAEIFRAGIEAVPRGQIEAARSLGLKGWQVARFVILPQAFRVILPPLGNELIAILKDTALLSIISVRDVTQRMREFQSDSFLTYPPYNSLAIFYVLLTLSVASLLKWNERRYSVQTH